jgi:hypothetical protein
MFIGYCVTWQVPPKSNMARASLINPWFGVLAAQLAAGRIAIDTVSTMMGGASRRSRASADASQLGLASSDFMRVGDGSRAGLHAAQARCRAARQVRACRCAVRAASGECRRLRARPQRHRGPGALERRAPLPYRLALRMCGAPIRFHRHILGGHQRHRGRSWIGSTGCAGRALSGGWLAAAFAARFPRKVRALVLAGAPIDIAAERSLLADLSAATPREAVDELLNLWDGLLLGRLMLAMWPLIPKL